MKKNLLPTLALIIAILALGLTVLPKGQKQLGGATTGATFGEAGASCSTNTLSTTSTKILSSDGKRSFWNVSNLGTSSVTLSFTNPATSSFGIVLNAVASSGNAFFMNYPSIDNGNIYAISSATGTVIGICTGNAL